LFQKLMAMAMAIALRMFTKEVMDLKDQKKKGGGAWKISTASGFSTQLIGIHSPYSSGRYACSCVKTVILALRSRLKWNKFVFRKNRYKSIYIFIDLDMDLSIYL